MTETDFLNTALGKSGLPPIANINDTSPNAGWCRVFYKPLRQTTLRGHNWNFAMKRVALQANALPPLFGYSFSYDLPADYLKIVGYNGDQQNLTGIDPAYWDYNIMYYRIEGRQLLTNDAVANIVYVADIENPALWPADFFQYLATMLSGSLIDAVWKDPKRAGAKLEEAVSVWLPQALAADGQESPQPPFIVDDLIRGRN